MTKEITAEIKSEIREVISQVEDVLENTETVDLQTVMANISRFVLHLEFLEFRRNNLKLPQR
jgi:hypothetical protein